MSEAKSISLNYYRTKIDNVAGDCEYLGSC